MSLREFLSKAVKPKLHPKFDDLLDREIEDVAEDGEWADATEVYQPESLSGLNLIIEYQDSKGKQTQRAITCRQLQMRADKSYVQAYCHHRGSPRCFRIDRIAEIYDPITGECLSPVQAFFAQFSPDKVTKSGLSWNLSISKRADLIALLDALVFLARCDREFHPEERDSLEQAIVSFWLEYEIVADCQADEILSYADRLAPDGETFWVAMHRFKEETSLAKVFRKSAKGLIDADGVVRSEEAYWAVEIDDFFSS